MTNKLNPILSRAYSRGHRYVDGVLASTAVSGFQYGWTDSLIGTDSPNWRAKIAAGQSATNSMSGVRQSLYQGIGRAEIETEHVSSKVRTLLVTTGAILGTDCPIPQDPGSYSSSSADLQARLKFLAKYRSTRTAFSGGVFLGELGETLRMLKSPAKAFRDAVNDYHYDAIKRSRKAIERTKKRVLQETYLEHMLGWKPLMRDIQSAYDLVQGKSRSYREVISASAEDMLISVVDAFQTNDPIGQVVFFSRKREGFVQVRYKGAVNIEFEKPPSSLEFLGLGLENFIPTVYNLIPYSFLVDYFSNVGKVIDAASLGSVSLAWGCKTTRKVNLCTVSNGRHVGNLGPTLRLIHKSVSLSGFVCERVSVGRSPLSGVQVSLLDTRFRVPGVGEPFKWLNIAALASLRSLKE